MRLIKPVLFILLVASLPASADSYGKLPLNFEANQGQTDARVQFLSHEEGHTLFLTSTEAVLRTGHGVFRMKLAGANPSSKAAGVEPQIAKSNYFIGHDPTKWRTGVANYSRVRFAEVYPGIDLVYYGKDRQLEYDWIVKPGADPSKIRLKFAGIKNMRVDRNGDLVLETTTGELRQKKPLVYQEKQIAGRYVIRGHEAHFEVGSYDRAKTLVIDPVLAYSSYLGGSAIDTGNAIAVDSFGNAYVTGWTNSTDFPTVNPEQSMNQGGMRPGSNCTCDVFITKVSADGSALLYSTYLGGTGDNLATGIAVDSLGDAYVTGWTTSTDFPVYKAYQSTYTILAGYSVFVTKLNPAGNAFVFSTYLGGTAGGSADGIALDTAGNAYITGFAGSNAFPTTSGVINQTGYRDGGNTFVAKMSADGSTLLYSTFLTSSQDGASNRSIAVDPNGYAYLTGVTPLTTYPTYNALQSTFTNGNTAAFVTKINPTASAFVYSTFLAGSGSEKGIAIAADSLGNAYVTGQTSSTNFPTVNPLQPHLVGSFWNAFVTKINPTGSALVYSTYLGGSNGDTGWGIAVDTAGEAWVAGNTGSKDFPIVNPLPNTQWVAAGNLFVSQLSASGSSLLFSSYAGSIITYQGKPTYPGGGIAVDSHSNAYVTAGTTNSTGAFPLVNAFQPTFGGVYDAVVLKISAAASSGAVFNDFTGDGESGALLYDPSQGQSYTALSNGNGTYSYTPNLFSTGFNILRTGDFNGDGKADLIVYNSQTASAYIGFGKGDGTFTFQSLFWSPGYNTVVTGDINGDGKTDVALYNSTTGTLYTGISNGDGTFTYEYHLVSQNFTYIKLADFSGDGKAGLFLYRSSDGLAYLGVGDGTGAFTFNPLSISVGYNLADTGDLNGDGKTDIILYNATSGNAATGISNGSGGFTFTPLVFSPGFTSVRLAKYTGHTTADVTVYNKNTAVAYFGTGTGTGNFTFQSLFWSPGYDSVDPEDVNGDGKTDIGLYNSATGTEYTGISNGDGTFTYTYWYWGIGKLLAQ